VGVAASGWARSAWSAGPPPGRRTDPARATPRPAQNRLTAAGTRLVRSFAAPGGGLVPAPAEVRAPATAAGPRRPYPYARGTSCRSCGSAAPCRPRSGGEARERGTCDKRPEAYDAPEFYGDRHRRCTPPSRGGQRRGRAWSRPRRARRPEVSRSPASFFEVEEEDGLQPSAISAAGGAPTSFRAPRRGQHGSGKFRSRPGMVDEFERPCPGPVGPPGAPRSSGGSCRWKSGFPRVRTGGSRRPGGPRGAADSRTTRGVGPSGGRCTAPPWKPSPTCGPGNAADGRGLKPAGPEDVVSSRPRVIDKQRPGGPRRG